MKVRAGCAGPAMSWPARLEIRILRKMAAGVDVKVPGRHHRVIGAGAGEVIQCPGQGGAAGHRQRASLAEVVLHVDDDKRPAHGSTVPRPVLS
ncbi:Uncharacterised protein [Mycobacteroides abscessus subsp. abscessus]|nr:Uncharacterised protein [Mycobacteroides abscessus subsp. abscessus]